MKAVIVYESMYGNTHRIAEQIAAGLRSVGDVCVVSVGDASVELLESADLVVVGGPTHVHAMTSATSRHAAIKTAETEGLTLDPAANDPGLRDWFEGVELSQKTPAAAFDTRVDGWAVFTGRASHGIARHLTGRGFQLVVEPESFLVDQDNHLVDNESDRATRWGVSLGAAMKRMLEHQW